LINADNAARRTTIARVSVGVIPASRRVILILWISPRKKLNQESTVRVFRRNIILVALRKHTALVRSCCDIINVISALFL